MPSHHVYFLGRWAHGKKQTLFHARTAPPLPLRTISLYCVDHLICGISSSKHAFTGVFLTVHISLSLSLSLFLCTCLWMCVLYPPCLSMIETCGADRNGALHVKLLGSNSDTDLSDIRVNTCGGAGRDGPSMSDCKTAYSGTSTERVFLTSTKGVQKIRLGICFVETRTQCYA